jgi:hypothetical protein
LRVHFRAQHRLCGAEALNIVGPLEYSLLGRHEQEISKMLEPRVEMLEMLEELIDQYSAFQRSRPDLPQGSLCDLSQDELELLVAEFLLLKSEEEAEPPERLQ